MSHFTVMIVTPNAPLEGEANVEDILAPYSEELSVDPYWEDDDITWSREYYSSEKFEPAAGQGRMPADATDEQAVEWLNAYHDEDERYRIHDGKVQRESTYNPDSKWDWWSVGGRWSGALPLKQAATGVNGTGGVFSAPNSDPTRCDQAYARDLDFETGVQDAHEAALERWGKWEDIVNEHGRPASWEEVLDKHGVPRRGRGGDIDAARTEYHEQPAIVAMKEAKLLGWDGSEVDDFLTHTMESYVEQAKLSAKCRTFAFLSEETGWMEPGSMGWFGMSTDTPLSRLEYLRKVSEALDSIPDDAVVTVVDCHI